ncbi:hypothetical protein MKW98_020644, partial [Papaver atlanticum]
MYARTPLIYRSKKKKVCQDNSDCTDEVRNGGHRCICNSGYEGNPYLINGCK